MTCFETTIRTDDVLTADADAVWDLMHDPDLLAQLTPAIARITTDGDLWCWHMSGISALGIDIAPAFWVRMRFDEEERTIRFSHEPGGGREIAGASGTYVLAEVPEGTYVGIDLTAHVELPVPALAGRAVRGVMERTIVAGGGRFGENLVRHLGATGRRGMERLPEGAPFPRIPQNA